MKKILVTMTDELIDAMNQCIGRGNRSEQIESWLWKQPEIRRAAVDLGHKIRPQRTPIGRPFGEEGKIEK